MPPIPKVEACSGLSQALIGHTSGDDALGRGSKCSSNGKAAAGLAGCRHRELHLCSSWALGSLPISSTPVETKPVCSLLCLIPEGTVCGIQIRRFPIVYLSFSHCNAEVVELLPHSHISQGEQGPLLPPVHTSAAMQSHGLRIWGSPPPPSNSSADLVAQRTPELQQIKPGNFQLLSLSCHGD